MSDDQKSEPNEEELDKLEEEIERARRDGDEAMHGSFYEGDQYTVVDGADDAAEDEPDA